MIDAERFADEIRSLLRYASGIGLNATTVREIYEAVYQEAIAAGLSDDERIAEVRKRMLAVARGDNSSFTTANIPPLYEP